jgi:very-short-patch-repair endonuclease
MTRIYLAGKIAKNDWRHDLVPMLRCAFSTSDVGAWVEDWPTTPMYRKDFQYVGPFFISCDHGCAHGENNHGAGATTSGCISEFPYRDHYWQVAIQQDVMIRCRQAIKDCDVFFAWLENPCTAYGTLVELGFAAAIGKTVVIGSADIYDDLWFAYQNADYYIEALTAETAFRQWAESQHPIDEQRAKCESPLELAFWDAYLCRKPAPLDGIVAQHQVIAGGSHYRLDFALPDIKVAFEMDGFTYHGDKEAFNRDRRRDLDLKLAGWNIHRFDGDLIRNDTPKVIHIAAELAAAHR